MIRMATDDDVPRIVQMVRSLKEHSPSLQPLDFAIDKVDGVVMELKKDPYKGIALVSDQDGPVGMILGTVTEMIFSHQLVAAELAWWMEPDYRKSRDSLRLIEAFEYWAKNIAKASLIQMSSTLTDQTPQIEKFYRRRGYHLSENAYLRKL